MSEKDFLLFSRQPRRGREKAGEEVVFFVKETGGNVQRFGKSLAHLKLGHVFAFLVLVDTCAGGEFVNSSVDAKLFLG